jgi:hypothetical protein
MSHKWTNASELAEYMYCRRAWWYKNVKGLDGAKIQRMETGSKYHARHGNRVRRLPWLRGLAYLLIFTAVAIVVFQLAIGV